MATVKILGDVFQIKSTLKEEEIKKAKRYAPDLLKLKDEEGNEVFAVDLGTPSISKYGICFGSVDENGFVFATITSDNPITKEDVVESFAPTITNLNFVETQVLKALESINAREAEMLENIETL